MWFVVAFFFTRLKLRCFPSVISMGLNMTAMLPLPRQSSWICDRSVLQSRPEWLAIHTWSAAPQLEPNPWFMQAAAQSTNIYQQNWSYVFSVGWFHVAMLTTVVVEAEDSWSLLCRPNMPNGSKKIVRTVFAAPSQMSQVPAVLRWYWGRACWFHPSSSICPCALSSSKKWFLWWDLPVSTPQPLFDSMYQKMDIETATFEEGQRFELMCLFAYCLG